MSVKMTGEELFRRYTAGERDFSGVDNNLDFPSRSIINPSFIYSAFA